MFTLTSIPAKISAFAFSTLVTFSFIDSVALGFQHQNQALSIVTLPAVTIVGHRADAMQDAVQVAGKREERTTL
jgi:hypothetical protein